MYKNYNKKYYGVVKNNMANKAKKKKQAKFSYDEIKEILPRVINNKKEIGLLLKEFSLYMTKKTENIDKSKKEYYKLINLYHNVLKKELEKNNLKSKLKIKEERKYLDKIIFRFLLEENSNVKKEINENNIQNLKELINFYIEKKKIEDTLFKPFEEPFRSFIEETIKIRHAINRKVPQKIRDDVVSILYKKYDLVKITIEKNNVETKNLLEELIKKVNVYDVENKGIGLFYYLLDTCEDLDYREASLLMLLLKYMNPDGSAYLCQKEAERLFKRGRDVIGRIFKSLKEKGYISEDKEHKYSYKNKLCKTYIIHLEKLIAD